MSIRSRIEQLENLIATSSRCGLCGSGPTDESKYAVEIVAVGDPAPPGEQMHCPECGRQLVWEIVIAEGARTTRTAPVEDPQ